MTDEVCAALEAFCDVLYERVYLTETVRQAFDRTGRILEFLWEYFMADEERFRSVCYQGDPDEPHWRAVTDFLTGMTDRYALRLFEAPCRARGASCENRTRLGLSLDAGLRGRAGGVPAALAVCGAHAACRGAV